MWIESVSPADASGELKALYDRIGGARGGIAAIHRAPSLNPKALGAHFELYKAAMFQPSPLSRSDREALAVAVSRANSCEYSSAHHGQALRKRGLETSLPEQVFDWAVKLARVPETVAADDVAVLRAAGLTDRATHSRRDVDGCVFLVYVNRLVMALWVALEPGFEATCDPELHADQ